MSASSPLPRPLRSARAAELLFAPVPLFLALTLPPGGSSRGLFLPFLLQSVAAVAIAYGLGRRWRAARAAALLLAAYVLALAVIQGPALATAAFGRRDPASVLALAVAAWAWLTQMVAFAGALPELTRSGRARRG